MKVSDYSFEYTKGEKYEIIAYKQRCIPDLEWTIFKPKAGSVISGKQHITSIGFLLFTWKTIWDAYRLVMMMM